MKQLLQICIFFVSLQAYGQVDHLVGKWSASVPSDAAETITYVFHEDQSMDLFYDDSPVMSTKPITYAATARQHMIELEIQFVQNNEIRQIIGLIQFLDEDRFKLELFPFDVRTDTPEIFTKNALIFRRE